MNSKVPSPRRRHGAELKAAGLGECETPGASVAAVALAHGLNANLVRKWLVGRGIKRTGLPAPRVASAPVTDVPSVVTAPASFVPVQLPPPQAAAVAPAKDVKVQMRRGATTVTLSWPAESAGELMTGLRELMK